MADEKHGRTLFIRNIPYSSTNDTLEKIFSDVGPIKSCFVVKDKESGKCRGFGYVKFTLFEDAEKALQTVKKIDGRIVHIVYANKKEKQKKFGKAQNAEQEGNPSTETKVQETKPETSTKIKKQKKVHVALKGQRQDPNPLNEGKRARLIIRNLSFKCSKEELMKAFGKHGDVVDVHIPKKACGTRLGFGFVQFKNRAQAGMAVKEINGTDISGRVVAVDWALPKDKFESKLAAKEDAGIKPEAAHDEGMEVDDDQDEESNGGANLSINIQDSVKEDRLEDSVKEDSFEDSGSSEEEDESSGEEEEEEDGSDDEDENGSEDNEDEDDSEENDSDVENETSKRLHSQRPERESDVNEGRTVFIRNLPYAIGNEELEEFFSQFGDVKYATVVVDRTSGMPKGSAFVQFRSKEATDSCMACVSRGEESDLSLGGRNLLVSLAVNKQQAGEFSEKDKKSKEQKDTRNLYLAREGMIRPGTEAAKDVPAADLAKRLKIDAGKRMKLKDQNIFVSSTRLCIHNIPPIVTDQSLRAVVAKAAEVKERQVTECRIMRDLDRVNSQGIGKSRGYAFCSFIKHEQALAALRKLNNNPDIFGNNKRLIVEFSLESRKALEAKQKRLEKSRAKLKQKVKESQNSNTSADNTANKRKRKPKGKGDYKPLEMKKKQDTVARSLHKGPLGLPSHSGPKQRHKARPSQQATDKNKAKNVSLRNSNPPGKWQQQVQQRQPKEKPVKFRSLNKKRNDTDSFDKLVAAYKQKILSSANF